MCCESMNMRKGQSLVEILLAVAIAGLLLPAVLIGLTVSREGKAAQEQRVFATGWLREGVEATRSVRDSGWNNIPVNGVYHPELSGGRWILTPGSQGLDGYTRSVIIEDVYRDANGDIAVSGTVDPSTKRLTVTVGWSSPMVTNVQSQMLVTRYLDNLAFTHTSEADFGTGTFTSTVSSPSNGGEITLGAGGGGDWCDPNLALAQLDLPKNGVANAITAIEGLVFAGTGDNASGVSLAKVGVTNANPPVPTIVGTFDGYKTNGGVFGETGYAYLATDTNAKEIVIINTSTNPFTEVGYFDSPGSTDSNSVFVAGNVGYMTVGTRLYNFDLTSKSGSRPRLDSDGVTLAGTGAKIYVVGNYAYVAIAGSSYELQIVDVSNPANMTIVASKEVDPGHGYAGENGRDVYVNSSGTRAYVVIAQSTTTIGEMYIIDTTNKSGTLPTIGSYDTQGMAPKGVTLVTGNKVLVVGSGGEEYQAVSVLNESVPVRCGGLEVNTGVNGVASVLESDGDAYSYIITGDSSSELKIIAGGPGGQYSASGTFESATVDLGYETVINRLSFGSNQPANTDVRLQLGIADAIGNSCVGVSFDFVGPDKTAGSYFSADNNTVPFDNDGVGWENPGRCVRYKATLSSDDIYATSIFSDITLNYSP